jgi:hypothetical protein
MLPFLGQRSFLNQIGKGLFMARLNAGMLVIGLLCFVGLSNDARAQETPGDVLKHVQKGFAENAWADTVKRLSPGFKKGLVYECCQGSIFLQEPAKKEFDDLLKNAGIGLEEAIEKAAALEKQDFIDVILSSVEDENLFLTKLYPIVFGLLNEANKQNGGLPAAYHGDMKNLEIENDRARAVLADHIEDHLGGRVEIEQPIFFRKYDGKWKFCLEGEWKDKNYKALLPHN